MEKIKVGTLFNKLYTVDARMAGEFTALCIGKTIEGCAICVVLDEQGWHTSESYNELIHRIQSLVKPLVASRLAPVIVLGEAEQANRVDVKTTFDKADIAVVVKELNQYAESYLKFYEISSIE